MKKRKWILPVSIVSGVIVLCLVAVVAFGAILSAKGFGISTGFLYFSDKTDPLRRRALAADAAGNGRGSVEIRRFRFAQRDPSVTVDPPEGTGAFADAAGTAFPGKVHHVKHIVFRSYDMQRL